jgi:hypothetical protein
MKPVTTFADEVMAATRWHNLAVIDYRGCWQLTHVNEIDRLYKEIFAEHSLAVGVTVAHPGTKMSSSEVNAKAAALMKSLRSRVVESFIVVEERGTMATIWRGVIRAVNVLAGQANIRVAASIAEAAGKLLPHVKSVEGWPVAELQLTGVIRRACELTNARSPG